MKRQLFSILMVLALLLSFNPAAAQDGIERPPLALPDYVTAARLDAPLTIENDANPRSLNPALLPAQGRVQVVLRLSASPVAQTYIDGLSRAAQQRQLRSVKSQQNAFLRQARQIVPSLVVLGSVQRVLNAVMAEVDAARLRELANHPSVILVNPVTQYELDLSETVPYIGATAVQNMGYTGEGVRVAVLDSGIDYTHANLGGSGSVDEYNANDPTIVEPGSFPTAKVVGGYDFVGSSWPNAPEAPDPDPLDAGVGGGHGTHVADIIGGLGGVAPDVDLYAVKVCSSVSSSCSGIALLQGMDFAIDPNGDGDVSDHVDLINMSLGSIYGQAFEDDLSAAVTIASKTGILTVASAGNSADKPFVTGTPAANPYALSVAQTEVPSAFLQLGSIDSPPAIAGNIGMIPQPWAAPLASTITAPVQFGNGAGGNTLGCNAFAAGSLAGKIVLVDRGTCSFSIKIANIKAGGGLAGLIGLITPDDPFAGGYGGGDASIPAYMIRQVDATRIKSGLSLGVTMTLDPANVQALVQHITGSSSRGPSNFWKYVKPEIGAPGASVSAIYGTGTGEGAFGGTSGAAPMVTGSAALLMQAYPDRAPVEIKATLVNNAEADIMNKTVYFGGYIAPITRVGGGEVRVDRAVSSAAAAWDNNTKLPTLSFGMHDVHYPEVILRHVTVRNYTGADVTYALTPTFRFANDEASGAVWFAELPSEVTVPAFGSASFRVALGVDGSKLPGWTMNSGANGMNAETLTLAEYDGYIWFDNLATTDDDASMLHLPWHILPRNAGRVETSTPSITTDGESGQALLWNTSVTGPANINQYSLLATSEDQPEAAHGDAIFITDLKYFGVQTYPVPAGYCSANPSFLMAFAISLWEPVTLGNYPGGVEVDLDTNQDGNVDFAIWNSAVSSSGGDYRVVVRVLNVATGTSTAFFYLSHPTNSPNYVYTICGEQIGMNAANFGQMIDAYVLGYDSYHTGLVTDVIEGLTFAPLGERYLGYIDAYGGGTLDPREAVNMEVLDFGTAGTNPGELGVLLFNDQPRGSTSSGAAPGFEALPVFINQP